MDIPEFAVSSVNATEICAGDMPLFIDRYWWMREGRLMKVIVIIPGGPRE